MIVAIIIVLFVAQIVDTFLIFIGERTKAKIYYSFAVWHLSLLFFAISGAEPITLLVQLLCCVLSYHNLSKLRVVEVIEVGDEVTTLDIKDEEELFAIEMVFTKLSQRGDEPDVRLIEMSFLEKRFFGLSKEVKKRIIPIALVGSDKEALKKILVGTKFDVIT